MQVIGFNNTKLIILQGINIKISSKKITTVSDNIQFIVCFLLGNSPASDLYMPTFRNTLSVPSS